MRSPRFRERVPAAPPDDPERKYLDFLMTAGDMLALLVYAQLILEDASIYVVDDGPVDQIFDVIVRDFARLAVDLHAKPIAPARQMEHCMRMIRKPAVDHARYERVWRDHV